MEEILTKQASGSEGTLAKDLLKSKQLSNGKSCKAPKLEAPREKKRAGAEKMGRNGGGWETNRISGGV